MAVLLTSSHVCNEVLGRQESHDPRTNEALALTPRARYALAITRKLTVCLVDVAREWKAGTDGPEGLHGPAFQPALEKGSVRARCRVPTYCILQGDHATKLRREALPEQFDAPAPGFWQSLPLVARYTLDYILVAVPMRG